MNNQMTTKEKYDYIKDYNKYADDGYHEYPTISSKWNDLKLNREQEKVLNRLDDDEYISFIESIYDNLSYLSQDYSIDVSLTGRSNGHFVLHNINYVDSRVRGYETLFYINEYDETYEEFKNEAFEQDLYLFEDKIEQDYEDLINFEKLYDEVVEDIKDMLNEL